MIIETVHFVSREGVNFYWATKKNVAKVPIKIPNTIERNYEKSQQLRIE